MSKPFDATFKHLLEVRARDCLAFVGLPAQGSVEVVDADVSTITTQADKVICFADPAPALAHLEFQASYDATLSQRTLRANVLLNDRHHLPVHSIVLLLRPAADGPEMTGIVRHQHASGRCYLEFQYQVIRLWQKPVDEVLTGGVGTLPLAPLTDVRREALPAVVQRMQERIEHETSREEAATLWTATYVLMGLRYTPAFSGQLLQGVRAMEESTTYQEIVKKGVAQGVVQGMAQGSLQEAKKLLLRQGNKRFGPPDEMTSAALEAVVDLERLEALSDRLLDVATWEELLNPPRPRNGRRKRSS